MCRIRISRMASWAGASSGSDHDQSGAGYRSSLSMCLCVRVPCGSVGLYMMYAVVVAARRACVHLLAPLPELIASRASRSRTPAPARQ
jgi:hypothetical protein